MATQTLENSNPRLLITEILRKVSNAKTKAEKINLLREHNSNALRQLLIWNFDDSVVSMIPEGEVPFTPNDAPLGTDHTRLEQEYRGLFRFVKGGQDSLKRAKRESMFIQLLEGLSKDEAELVCLVKDGKLTSKYKRITKTVIQEAFPQIIWGNRS
tara:strand:- start:3901 stop:4368 length:468 start_codon:yes stop_codon:yes gene_type:complete